MLIANCSFVALLLLSSFMFLTLTGFISTASVAAAQPITTTTPDGGSGLNFDPLNFVSNMFNSSSILGTAGISMVDGVKVTGINLLPGNQVSVNLRQITTGSPVSNTSLPRSVTVMALRVPMNLHDLISLATAASGSTSNNNSMITSSMQGYDHLIGNNTGSLSEFNPFSLLKNIQIGSSSLVNADWRLSQTVTMGLTGANNNSNSSHLETADFIIVTVIPYTGLTNLFR